MPKLPDVFPRRPRSSLRHPMEMRRLQVGLALFVVLWESLETWADFRDGQQGYAALDAVTALVCLGLMWLIVQGRVSVQRLGVVALLMAATSFFAVLADDILHTTSLTALTYLDAIIVLGLAFALLRLRPALLIAASVDLLLVAAFCLAPHGDVTLLGGELFISALLTYIVLHNRSVLSIRNEADRAHMTIEEMMVRDNVTGLQSRAALEIHLARQWSRMDDYQRGYTALLEVQVADFQGLTHTLGGEAGNHLLQKVAVYLIQGSELRDVVARGQGPSFVLLLHNVKKRDVQARLDALAGQLQGPLWLGGPSIRLKSGCVFLGEATTPEEALALATRRCTAEKSSIDTAALNT